MLEDLPKLARLLLAVVAFALIAAAAAYAADSPAPDSDRAAVAVDSTPVARSVTGSKGITIHTRRAKALQDPTPVYSVRLQDIDPPERVHITGTVPPAYCVGSDIKGTDHLDSPCQELAGDGLPTKRYTVEVEAILYRTERPGNLTGSSAKPLPGRTARASCTFDRHHCPLTVKTNATLGARSRPFISLGVIAWTHSPDRARPDRMDLDCFEVGRRCDTRTPTNGPIPGHPGQRAQQPGQLSVTRFGADYDREESQATATSTRIDGSHVQVSVSRAFEGGTVAHSTRLDGLEPGDVLEARGTAELTGDGFDHLGGSYWVLARQPGTIAATLGTPDRYVSPLNGVNCLGAEGVLTDTLSGYCSATREPPTLPLQQAGAIAVPAKAPSTMYLNYVVLASDGSVPEGSTPSAEVDSVSTRVSCFSQPRAALAPPCSIATP